MTAFPNPEKTSPEMPAAAQMADMVLVLTTVSSRAEAQALAQRVVHARLAACVHLQALDSVYLWKDQLRTEGEWRLLCKTTVAASAALQAELRAAHPYELPAIIALPARATAEFAQWLAGEVQASG